MGKPRSKLIPYHKLKFPEIYGFTTEVHFGRQAKHMPGQPEYDPSRSPVTVDILTIQRLVLRHAGRGTLRGKTSNKETVNFGVIIGNYRSPNSTRSVPTTWVNIHYSKTGAHIVPATPREEYHVSKN
ncbi:MULTISPECIES: polymorphic toxin type 50 domain-containing protein [Actinotignum]|uniref:polymorphic toxin type 50 domain-containing protein n=2 Tax=Actinomycetaceae TaxID=2049 RepID=UPI000F7EFF42|nr:transposase [Actinotignum sanguinis]